MSDILSLFRFVLPGTVYIVVLLLALIFYDVDSVKILLAKSNTNALSFFVTVFFISGTVGYLLNHLYRLFSPAHGFRQVDLVNTLQEQKIMNVVYSNGEVNRKLKNDRRNRIRAYEIINVVWHLNVKKFDESKTEFQASLVNSFGATLLAIAFAIPTFFIIDYKYLVIPFDFMDYTRSVGFLLLLLYSFGVLYNQSRNLYERWINSTVISKLKSNDKELIKDITFIE